MTANYFTNLTDEQLLNEFASDKSVFDRDNPTNKAPLYLDRTSAQYLRIGKWYYENSSLFQYNKSLDWLFKADHHGDKEAAHYIGRIYFDTGSGSQCEYAYQWFRKGALSGNSDSEYYLGEMYSQGRGVLKDISEALTWYTKAAFHGHLQAQLKTGTIYAETPNHRESVIKAYYWLSVAAKANSLDATKALAKLKKNTNYDIEDLVQRENPYPHLKIRSFPETKNNEGSASNNRANKVGSSPTVNKPENEMNKLLASTVEASPKENANIGMNVSSSSSTPQKNMNRNNNNNSYNDNNSGDTPSAIIGKANLNTEQLANILHSFKQKADNASQELVQWTHHEGNETDKSAANMDISNKRREDGHSDKLRANTQNTPENADLISRDNSKGLESKKNNYDRSNDDENKNKIPYWERRRNSSEEQLLERDFIEMRGVEMRGALTTSDRYEHTNSSDMDVDTGELEPIQNRIQAGKRDTTPITRNLGSAKKKTHRRITETNNPTASSNKRTPKQILSDLRKEGRERNHIIKELKKKVGMLELKKKKISKQNSLSRKLGRRAEELSSLFYAIATNRVNNMEMEPKP